VGTDLICEVNLPAVCKKLQNSALEYDDVVVNTALQNHTLISNKPVLCMFVPGWHF
jgi:hypothetical protein